MARSCLGGTREAEGVLQGKQGSKVSGGGDSGEVSVLLKKRAGMVLGGGNGEAGVLLKRGCMVPRVAVERWMEDYGRNLLNLHLRIKISQCII